jgi:hypothetical protein
MTTVTLPRTDAITVAGIDYQLTAERDPNWRVTDIDNEPDRVAFEQQRWAYVMVTVRPTVADTAISELVGGIIVGHRPSGEPADILACGELRDLSNMESVPAVVDAIDRCRDRLNNLARELALNALPADGPAARSAEQPGDPFTAVLTAAQFTAAVPPLARYRLADIAAALAAAHPEAPALLAHDGSLYEVTGRYVLVSTGGFYSETTTMMPPPWSGASQRLPVPVVDSDRLAAYLRRPSAVGGRAATVTDAHAAARLLADVVGMLADLMPAGHDPLIITEALADTMSGLDTVLFLLPMHLLRRCNGVGAHTVLQAHLIHMADVLADLTTRLNQVTGPRTPRVATLSVRRGPFGHIARAEVRDRFHPTTSRTIEGDPAPNPGTAIRSVLTAVTDQIGNPTLQRGVPALIDPQTLPIGRLTQPITTGPDRRDYRLTVALSGPIDPVAAAAAAYPAVTAVAGALDVRGAWIRCDTDDAGTLTSPVSCRPDAGPIEACLLPAHHLGRCSPQPGRHAPGSAPGDAADDLTQPADQASIDITLDPKGRT